MIDATQAEVERTELQVGDLLFVEGHANPQEVGRVASWDGSIPRCVHQNHLIRFRPNPEVLLPEYAVRWFNSSAGAKHFQRSGKTTSGLNTISASTVRSAPTLLPPLDAQRRIAAVLDRAAGLSELRRTATDLINQLPAAVFLEMFGDPGAAPSRNSKSLGELVDLYSGGTPSKANPRYWQGDLPWFSPKDLKSRVLHDSIDHVSESAITSTSLKPIPRGTVLIVVRGMILAHTVPISIVETRCTINQDLKALMPRVEIEPLFLHTALAVQHSRILACVGTAAHGTKRIEVQDLKSIRIPRPGVGAEKEFVMRAIGAESMALAGASQETVIDELFSSLQSRAFSGDL